MGELLHPAIFIYVMCCVGVFLCCAEWAIHDGIFRSDVNADADPADWFFITLFLVAISPIFLIYCLHDIITNKD